MNQLKVYLSSLPKGYREQFAEKAGTSVSYLRKAISKKQQFGISLCVALVKASKGGLAFEDLRPDVDWNFIRKTKGKK